MQGVTIHQTKMGTITYRSSVTYHNKHISLGTYPTKTQAQVAYSEACALIMSNTYSINDNYSTFTLYHEKIIVLLNFRDHELYIRTPIYLYKHYFNYYLSSNAIMKFDLDDLFYLSTRKIMCRGNHYFVADYGMQVSLHSRFGIKNYAVESIDYTHANGDPLDYRRSNLTIYSHYHGVHLHQTDTHMIYKTYLHLLGNVLVGTYLDESSAAIAYNKATDLFKDAGCSKNFPINFIEEYSASAYAKAYSEIELLPTFYQYLNKTTF